MKLYYMTGACSMASVIALHEAGIKFQTASVDRKNRKTSDGLDYAQVSSKGYVPALLLDDGQILTRTSRCCYTLRIVIRRPGWRRPTGRWSATA